MSTSGSQARRRTPPSAPKLDLRATLGDVYRAARTPRLIEVPELQILAVDGCGAPTSGTEYRDALQALFGAAYGMRFALRAQGRLDCKVMPLETTWTVEPSNADPKGWTWSAFIVQPPQVTPADLESAKARLETKAPKAAVDRLSLRTFAEGRCAQILHVGPYDAEEPTVTTLHRFIAAQGLEVRGPQHEIYLSDPGRCAPERLRTIVRQSVRERC